MPAKDHILVIRFSAMGDVAMTVPVIKQLLQQNPYVEITVLSNALYAPFFKGLERCNFYPVHLKKEHAGIKGMYKLYKEVSKLYSFNKVADLHAVLRSSIFRFLCSFSAKQIAVIDKGRAEKKALTRKEDKILHQLTTTHERYANVFRKLGYALQLDTSSIIYPKLSVPANATALFQTNKKIIGIAPFAQHKEKVYPLPKLFEVVKALSQQHTILLFGSGGAEAALLQQWTNDLSNTHLIAGNYKLDEELAIISNLHVMVSMDSANMHLASLFKVPVVSVWGATHHFAGFYGWAQPVENIVETDLYCRPCSVFGNKPCYRGDHACMEMIDLKTIIQKIDAVVSAS